MRLLYFVIIAVVLMQAEESVHGQYLHIFKDADGKAVLAVYQGNSDWLAKQDDPQSHLHDLKDLTSVQLVQHNISLPEMRYVASLKHLRFLTIGQAPEAVDIDRSTLSVLSECRWLEGVSICKTNLKDDDLQVLQKLPIIKRITIEGGDLCNAGTPHGLSEQAVHVLVSIKTLEDISIRGDAGFSDRSVEELATLPKLKSLELDSSKLTDKTLEIIATKMKLRELWIRSPQFTAEGIRKLKEATKIDRLTIEHSMRP
jgi:hypothetical protein